jgi:hypothetical protein
MNGRTRSARLRTAMMARTRTSALAEEFIGGTWYHIVYSHSHGWPGQLPAALLRILWRGGRQGQELAAATSGPRRCEAARVDGSWRTS